MWRILAAGVKMTETGTLLDVDGFRAALFSSWLDLSHRATRRWWRIPLLEARSFEHGPNGSLVVIGTKGHTELPNVASTFVDGLASRLALLLPGAPATAVTFEELAAHSTRYHLLVVRARGHHEAAFEGSRFGGAWLTIPRELDVARASGAVEVEGLFLSDPALHAAWRGSRGYGHMGMSPAELIAYRYTKL